MNRDPSMLKISFFSLCKFSFNFANSLMVSKIENFDQDLAHLAKIFDVGNIDIFANDC